jgi:hypothetical protein
VTLTPRGRALREQAERIPSAVVDRLGVQVEDLLALHRSLTSLIAHAGAALADA